MHMQLSPDTNLDAGPVVPPVFAAGTGINAG
jgi:hypothetical protein